MIELVACWTRGLLNPWPTCICVSVCVWVDTSMLLCIGWFDTCPDLSSFKIWWEIRDVTVREVERNRNWRKSVWFFLFLEIRKNGYFFFPSSQIDCFLEEVFQDLGFRREIYGKIYRFQDSEIYSEGRNKIVVDTPGIYTVFNIAWMCRHVDNEEDEGSRGMEGTRSKPPPPLPLSWLTCAHSMMLYCDTSCDKLISAAAGVRSRFHRRIATGHCYYVSSSFNFRFPPFDSDSV